MSHVSPDISPHAPFHPPSLVHHFRPFEFLSHHKIWIVVGIAIALVLGLAAATIAYSVSAANARTAAQDTIARAEKAIDTASLAAEPGSPEEAELNTARQSLADANGFLATGSFFFTRGAYRDANKKAGEAEQTANTINKRVTSLFGAAAVEDPLAVANNFGESKTFELYQKYPRTPEATTALTMAEDKFVSYMNGTLSGSNTHTLPNSDTDTLLRAAADFSAAFPIKSDKIVNKTKELAISLATANLGLLNGVLKENQDDIAKMNTSGGGSGTFGTTDSPAYTGGTGHLRKMLNAFMVPTLYQSPETQRLFSLLTETSAMSEEIAAMKPIDTQTSGNVTTSTYSQSQIDRVSEITAAMAPKLSEAQTLLNAVKAQP